MLESGGRNTCRCANILVINLWIKSLREDEAKTFFPSVLSECICLYLLTDKVRSISFSDQSVYYKIFILLMRSTFLPLSLSLSYFYFEISRSSNRIRETDSDSALSDRTAINRNINFAWESHESRDRKRRKTPLFHNAIFSTRELCSRCELYGKFECAQLIANTSV